MITEQGGRRCEVLSTWIPKQGVRTTLRWVGGDTPCSDPPTELYKSVINLICVIRDARAFTEVVAAAVAWSSEGLDQWAELKGVWRVGQKRERAPGCICN